MKRKLAGWLLVGLPIAIYFGLIYWTNSWMGIVVVLSGLTFVGLMAFAVVRGIKLITGL